MLSIPSLESEHPQDWGKITTNFGGGNTVFAVSTPNGEVVIKKLTYRSLERVSLVIQEVSITKYLASIFTVPLEKVFYSVEYVSFGKSKIYLGLVTKRGKCDMTHLMKENIWRNPKVRLHAVKQMMEAVRWCHAKGIVHSDIKPDNFIVYDSIETNPSTPNFLVKLTDFGISSTKVALQTQGSCYHRYTIFYRPPEIFLGKSFDTPGDVWALGVTIWELYEGHKPFHGDKYILDLERCVMGNILKKIKADADDKATLEKKLVIQVNPAFTSRILSMDSTLSHLVLKKMLVWKPEDRATMEEICQGFGVSSPSNTTESDTSSKNTPLMLSDECLENITDFVTQTRKTLMSYFEYMDYVNNSRAFFHYRYLLDKYLVKQSLATDSLPKFSPEINQGLIILALIIGEFNVEKYLKKHYDEDNFKIFTLVNEKDDKRKYEKYSMILGLVKRLAHFLDYDLLVKTEYDFWSSYSHPNEETKLLSLETLFRVSVLPIRYPYDPERLSKMAIDLANQTLSNQ